MRPTASRMRARHSMALIEDGSVLTDGSKLFADESNARASGNPNQQIAPLHKTSAKSGSIGVMALRLDTIAMVFIRII